VKVNEAATKEYSNFFNVGGNWDFFSDSLPLATSLQRAQGCLPSKVRDTASEKILARRFWANMDVHATDCKINQCAPIAPSNAKTVNA